jgi:glycosyltransferase involved in cell wall biosynthesis
MSELVTVVIPTFNRARCLQRAIKSVLAQTYNNFELIVVDDGSTDSTSELLAGFGQSLQVIRQQNSGPSMARNAGIRAARGKFIAFLDSDDEWLPEKLEHQLPLMRDQKVVLSVTNWRSAEPSASGSGFDSLDFEDSWVCDRPGGFVMSHPGQHHIMLSSWLVRRDTVFALGGFNSSVVPVEDNDLLFRLAFEGRFALTKRILLIRETGLDSVKLSRPGTLKYQRRIARVMCLAIANARVLAFSEPKLVQRQFSRAYAYFLSREMEFAALDQRAWQARRRALETLMHSPGRRERAMACLGLIAPSLVRRRMLKKYQLAN